MKYTIRKPEDLGAVVAERRLKSGDSQAELAKSLGLSQSYIQKIEAGRTSQVTRHVFRVLRRLNATITITFDDPDE